MVKGEKERWTWHPRLGDHYAISSFGRVCHYQYRKPENRPQYCHNQKILKPFEDGHGFLMVSIWIPELEQFKPYHVHRLVLEAFIGLCHKDGKLENNRLSNLLWASGAPVQP